ncbi:tumor protein p63-regulated gene 1-like protein [Carcharodon carcharias]|uniref:tumor protein p63-regulated gene 1-like protein n=1 Tax=Carcharodon carcharias TaxID=13397 RepID=UPI001B7E9557|nr:tumor protein p63-regulated gene 1-like protein [Carcharodon carcharias]
MEKPVDPAPQLEDPATLHVRMEGAITPGALMEESGNPFPRVEESGNPYSQVEESGNPYSQVEDSGNPYSQVEESGNPFPQVEESGNPFTQRLEPATPHDLSRLYPPHPRGDYTPPHITPASGPSTRDDYFVLRPGCIEEAIKDIGMKLTEEEVQLQNSWLLTEIDHWNREAERLLLITPRALLVCQYNFVELHCNEVLRVPLNYIDTISYGPFTFPETSLSRRPSSGLRIQWDKLREPSFLDRWNPWSRQIPFLILTEHPAVWGEGTDLPVCQELTLPSPKPALILLPVN